MMQNSSEKAWGTEVLPVVQGDWRKECDKAETTSEKALRTKPKGSDLS